MSFIWARYLDVATELFDASTDPSADEARLRSSIGRAYYAVYGTARDYMVRVDQQHITPKILYQHRKTSHQFVIDWFKQVHRTKYGQVKPAYTQVGENIGRLFRRRVQADYKDNYSDPPFVTILESCLDALVLAQSTLNDLSYLKP